MRSFRNSRRGGPDWIASLSRTPGSPSFRSTPLDARSARADAADGILAPRIPSKTVFASRGEIVHQVCSTTTIWIGVWESPRLLDPQGDLGRVPFERVDLQPLAP